MLSLFKKPVAEKIDEKVDEKVDERRQELATVEVRDIKQYLMDEYERSQRLLEHNEYLKRRLEEAEEIKIKYDASLVTLDAYQKRLESQEKRLTDKDGKIESLQRQLADIREELNTCKIQLTRAALTKDEIKEEVVAETKKQIIQDIQEQKGSLSKMRVIGVIQRSEVKGREQSHG